MTSAIEPLLNAGRPLRWLFTGDSITHGAMHTHGERDYVQLVEERVRWELGRRRDHVLRTAISGRTIVDLAGDLEWSISQYRPDLVSLMFGLNDCATPVPNAEAFADSYDQVIKALLANGVFVIVHTPNRILSTETKERQLHLPAYVESVREVATANGTLLVDHYAQWERAAESGAVEYWIDHGCHPNAAGHRVLFRAFMMAIGLWDPMSPTGRFYIPALEHLDTAR